MRTIIYCHFSLA